LEERSQQSEDRSQNSEESGPEWLNFREARLPTAIPRFRAQVIEPALIMGRASGTGLYRHDVLPPQRDDDFAFRFTSQWLSWTNRRVGRVRLTIESQFRLIARLNAPALHPHADITPAIRFRLQRPYRWSGDAYLGYEFPGIAFSHQDQRRTAAASTP
jgi:hypothetical protein